MKYLLAYLLVTTLLLSQQVAYAQPNNIDLQLANQYYRDGDFEKAVMYFERIYPNVHNTPTFNKYYESLFNLERYKEAEKLVKSQRKFEPQNLSLEVFHGKIYIKEGDQDKAKKLFNKTIDGISKDTKYSQINNLSYAFQKENLLDFAIATYQKANEIHPYNTTLYNQNIAILYGAQGKTEEMINTLLDMVDKDDRYIKQTQNALSRSINFKDEPNKVALLKNELLIRSQKNPNKSVYNELLAWLFLQKGDFNNAFIQIKALDKKNKEDGFLVMDLAETCINNHEYDIAIKCYDYVKDLGENSPNYRYAELLKLSTLKLKLTEEDSASNEELNELKQSYITTIKRIGHNQYSIKAMLELANLEGYYLNNVDTAITILNNALQIGGLSNIEIAEIKVNLADSYVIHGNIWDASLLYMQVEKAFKHEPIGHEAKFKNAKVFYYAGDFGFAQGILDVLKASSSKLIANDALELSLLITDNTGMDEDTTYTALKTFAAADLLIQQHKYNEAEAAYDSIIAAYGYHSLNDDILYRKAQIEDKRGNTDKAISYLLEITKNYSDDILADNAWYMLGQIYDYKLNDKQAAYEAYKTILFDFKGSLYTVEARKRFRELRESGQVKSEPTIIE